MRGNAAANSVCTKQDHSVGWSYTAFLILWSRPFQEALSLRGRWTCPAKGWIGDQSLGHELQAIMEHCKCCLNYRDSWRPSGVRNSSRDCFLSKPALNRRHTDIACRIAFDWVVCAHIQILDVTEAQTCSVHFFLCSVVTTLASLECDVWTLLQVSDVRPVPQDTQDKLCKG